MLEEVKKHIKIDGDEEDSIVSSLITAAETFLSNAGVEPSYEDELYIQAIKMLAGSWYDNRDAVGESNTHAFSLKSIITQLSAK